MPSISRIALLTLLGACNLTPALRAQSVEADLQVRLINKTVYLRGCWANGKLHFDSTGKILDKSGQVSVTLCGFVPTSVRLENKKLVLKGNRVGLALLGMEKELRPFELNKPIRIEIDASSNGDYSPALGTIFVTHLADMVPLLPAYWQGYAQQHFAQTTPPVVNRDSQAEQPRKIDTKKPGGVTPPIPIKTTEPKYNDFARGLKYSGSSLIHFWVEQDGTPSHFSIARPLGLGLDECALEAVRQYRFKPAMENGKPVLVEMYVAVNFQIF